MGAMFGSGGSESPFLGVNHGYKLVSKANIH